LTKVQLEDTAVSGEGLTGFPGVEVLWLNNTRISDAQLKHIAEMSKLQILVLDGTAVTDDGMSNLKALKALPELSLNRTRITDAGLKQLQSLSLGALYLEGTQVTEAAADQFRKATGADVFTDAHPDTR
jgi:hypothetical protein